MDAKQLEIERSAIAERYPTVVQAVPEIPTFEGAVDVDGTNYFVRLVLPRGFPTLPPEVGEIEQIGGRLILPVGGMHTLALSRMVSPPNRVRISTRRSQGLGSTSRWSLL